MDCLEFRRWLGSDPHVGDAAAREHLQSCRSCAEAYARAQAFEAHLATAFAVPVPAGLEDRILLAQLTRERSGRRSGRSRLRWIGLAAAAGLVLALGLWQWRAPPSLARLVVEHVTGPHEREALARTAPLPAADVRKAFADRGVELASVPDDVAYVSECPVGPYRTVHMVMPRGGAPVSVVYVVRHRVPGDAVFTRDGLHGREVPLGAGTLVMLARDDAAFDALEDAWREAIEGPAAADVRARAP